MRTTQNETDQETAQNPMSDLLRLAARQHGVVSRPQARALGLGSDALAWMIRSGRWTAVSPAALALTGSTPSSLQTASIALRSAGPDAALSHETSGAFWDIPGFTMAPAHVLTPHGRRRAEVPGILHHTRRLPAHHVVEIEGLIVTSPPRTIFDLSGTLRPRWRIERALDHAWAARLVSFGSMMRVIGDMGGRGQRNVAQLRKLVLERGPQHVAGESALERRFHRLLADDGQTPMTPQPNMVDDEGWWGRLDAADHDAQVLVEIDGDRWHSALIDREEDERRRARSEANGYCLLRFSDHDVWYRPAAVVATVRRARADGRRRHQLRLAS